jgi:hypothetical protein
MEKFLARAEPEDLFAAFDWFDPTKLQSLDAQSVIAHFKCIMTVFVGPLLLSRAE